jgi:hypothetical protein
MKETRRSLPLLLLKRSAVPLLAMVLGAALAWQGLMLYRFGAWGTYGTRIFYDQYHVNRHFIDGENARGEWKYHTVSGYAEFRRALERAGYDLYVHKSGRIRPGMLDGFDIYFIGEQTPQGVVMNDDERAVIFDFVKKGGGMWVTAEHTNHHEIGTLFNRFMQGTGVQARFDSICEDNGTVESRDWVAITDLKKHPITEGVEDVHFYNGCSLVTDHGIGFSSDRSWSDAWNPDASPIHNGNNLYDEGELKGPLTALAALTYGKGKIAVTCDHNPFSNPSFFMGSHERLLMNAMKWFAGPRWNKAFYCLGGALLAAVVLLLIAWRSRAARVWVVAAFIGAGALAGGGAVAVRFPAPEDSFDILFAEINKPSATALSKDPDGLWGLFEHTLKTDTVNVWLRRRILPGYEALALVAPTERFSPQQLEQLDGYLDRGKSVIYFATAASLKADAGRQLMERFGFEVGLDAQASDGGSTREFKLTGAGRIHRRVDRVVVRRDVALPHLEGAGWKAVQRASSGKDGFDFVAEKRVGSGRIVVVMPTEILMNRAQSLVKDKLDFVDLVMGLAEWIEETGA